MDIKITAINLTAALTSLFINMRLINATLSVVRYYNSGTYTSKR